MALTFKQKIVTGFLALGLVPVMVYGAISSYMNYQAGVTQAEQSLSSFEKGLEQRLDHYFLTIHAQARTMASNPAVHDALKNLRAAIQSIDSDSAAIDTAKLRARYVTQQEKTPGSKPEDVDAWMPKDAKTRLLQSIYISENPNPLGEKQKLDNAGDGSIYSLMHARYHPAFRDFVEEFGYYDMFIVDAETGYIVYTDFKEIDFMTNVYEKGPLYNSGLHTLARQVMESKDPKVSTMNDFARYMPSYNDWAAFVGVPIVQGGEVKGALLFQMPVGVMNDMFSGIKEMGQTGDGFIISAEGVYRTDPLRDEAHKIGDRAPDSMIDVLNNATNTADKVNYTWKDRNGTMRMGAITKLHVPTQSGNAENLSTMPWLVAVSMASDEVLAPVWRQIWVGLGMLLVIALAALAIGISFAGVLVKPLIQLGQTFQGSSKQVSEATGQVNEAVGSMVAASEETAAQSKLIRQSSKEAADNMNVVASSVSELNVSINDISQSIGEANALIDDAVQKAQSTDKVVRNLAEATGRISEVVTLINGLAEQTNLLALNAAIEAARAGEAGRGFAVVADEVKKLSGHTSQATVDIQEQIRNIQNVSEESAAALKVVVDAIHRIRDSATTVSAAVEEQSGVARQIANSVDDAASRVRDVDTNMVGIEEAANDTGVASNQVSGAAGEVNNAFKSLQQQVGSVFAAMGIKS
ncbi:MAG: methyl-accepting chemotaxis protein [Pseudomonadaceae bacterium]|nr:methyl-accepting chemotaxis protein [Pseudomonadaceae bacterium]